MLAATLAFTVRSRTALFIRPGELWGTHPGEAGKSNADRPSYGGANKLWREFDACEGHSRRVCVRLGDTATDIFPEAAC